MTLENPAYVISAASHSAALFRQAAQTHITGAGVVESGDLLITANGTPNMSVNVAAGMVWIPGTLGATTGFGNNVNAQTTYGLPAGKTSQGLYCGYQDGTVNLTISASNPTNPRIDLIVASIQDAQYSGTNNQPVLQVITGTPNASPTAPAAPSSSVVLAQVLVGANVTSITSGNITDTRTIAATNGGILAAASSSQYPSNPAAGDYVDDASLKQLLRYSGSAWQVMADTAAWTTYTPVWSGESGGGSNLGTGGSITGRYKQIGKIVTGTLTMLLGTSATGPGGVYNWSLPVTPAVNTLGSGVDVACGPAIYVGGTYIMGVSLVRSTQAKLIAQFQGSSAPAQSGNPSGWGSGVRVELNFTYEAA